MNGERVFTALLTLYPETFRREYGDAVLDAFRDVRAHADISSISGRLRFWIFLIADLCRSAGREQLRECTTEPRRRVIRWMAVCGLSAIVAAVLANGLSWAFSYLYHPYLEGVSLAPWVYGAVLGVGLGAAQSVVLRQRWALRVVWLFASAVSTAFGLELAIRVGSVSGPLVCGLVLGTCVGTGQWLVLSTWDPTLAGFKTRSASWIGASALALSIAALAFRGAMEQTLAGMNPIARSLPTTFGSGPFGRFMSLSPTTWSDLAIQVFLLATAGVVVGALTAHSLSITSSPRSSRPV